MSRRPRSRTGGGLSVIDLVRRASPGVIVGGTNETSLQAGVPTEQICFAVATSATTVETTLIDGSRRTLPISFERLRSLVKGDHDWRKLSITTIANLRNLVSLRQAPGSDYFFEFRGGATALLTRNYVRDVSPWLNLPSMDHVIPLTRQQECLLDRKVHDFETRFEQMSDEELRANFCDSAGALNVTRFMANFVWQQACLIRAGLLEPYTGGNVRTLWYQIWPRLSRFGGVNSSTGYKALSEQLAELVARGVLSYKLFGLYDPEDFVIGTKHPNVILVAEKRAHYYFLQQIHREAGVTVIATGGIPSTMSDEYFALAVKAAVPNCWKKDLIHVITLVDFDPAGKQIADILVDDLRRFGIKHPSVTDLVLPGHFSEAEREVYKVDLEATGKYSVAELRRWVRRTGGIGKKPFGLETDALMTDRARVRSLFLEAAAPWIGGAGRTRRRRRPPTRPPPQHAR